MGRYLYSALFYLFSPLILARLLYRSKRAPAYAKRWSERLGFMHCPPEVRGAIWVHAVSVGEVVAAVPLIERILKQYPERPVVVTTMTPTGSARLKAALGDQVFHVYAPYDTPDCVQRLIRKIQPSALLIMETELWPNMLHYTRKSGARVLLVNARLSERSMKGYARVGWLARPMLQSLSSIYAQDQAGADRFQCLGVNPQQIEVTGSIKYDLSVADEVLERGRQLRTQMGIARPVWIAASTHEGEDDIILKAHKTVQDVCPEAILILVPRHPERFNDVVRLAAKVFETGVSRKSDPESISENTRILVGDTMGELMEMYAASDIAFVGGSLIPRGGHNPLEPAALGLPVMMGDGTFNFAEICAALEAAGGLHIVSEPSLSDQVLEWLKAPQRAAQVGEQAGQFVAENRGALDRVMALIKRDVPGL
ncbi:MAG: lipid IV(A) 3-deoxy-D-manno-octulosonic acid transferase [Pseudomonadales bacterium]|nr:lipid IV(A) 3-deoxy-D-manno-octulosonic acid transferase [Pseudomonadales bacterium]